MYGMPNLYATGSASGPGSTHMYRKITHCQWRRRPRREPRAALLGFECLALHTCGEAAAFGGNFQAGAELPMGPHAALSAGGSVRLDSTIFPRDMAALSAPRPCSPSSVSPGSITWEASLNKPTLAGITCRVHTWHAQYELERTRNDSFHDQTKH
jgi:hypothetical protein